MEVNHGRCFHSLAIKTNGSLWAWGKNDYGQLGIGSMLRQNTPQPVVVGSTWSSVAGGGFHTVGIKGDGSLWAWGDNSQGQLGTGDMTQQLSPQAVATGTAWSSTAAGGYHSLAIKPDGSLWTWGNNSFWPAGVWRVVCADMVAAADFGRESVQSDDCRILSYGGDTGRGHQVCLRTI